MIFIPRPLYLLTNSSLLTHESVNKYQIVDNKKLPQKTSIIGGPVFTFFHNEVVRCLLDNSASISNIKGVILWRKSDGFETNDYSTLDITNRLTFRKICSPEFEPSSINMVDENKVIFFSRAFFKSLQSITQLIFEECPPFYLTPLLGG